MRTAVKKQRYSATKGNSRGGRGSVIKCVKKTESGKKKVIVRDWQHLSGTDADIIVRLINNPPEQNQAAREARDLYLSIPQLG